MPDYVKEPQSNKQKKAKARYDKIKGSTVNPILRQGNSDRRVSLLVKNYARKNTHYMDE